MNILSKLHYKILTIAALFVMTLVTGIALVSNVSAQTTASFRTGDILTGGDRSRTVCDWCDPVNAQPGDVIEFRMLVQNMTPGTTMTNVLVQASLPSTPGTSPLTAQATATADNASAVSDTLTVNVTGSTPQAFAYIPGHARVFSPACPNGCDAGDTVTSTGINVGSLNFGESAQVAWKAYVTNYVSSSPSPSPSPSPSASVSPSPSPSGNNQSNNCGNGTNSGNTNINCSNNIGGSTTVTQNITNNAASTAQPQVVATAATPVHELPKTGAPIAALALSGLLPAGLGLKKFGKSKDVTTPLSILEEREEKRLD